MAEVASISLDTSAMQQYAQFLHGATGAIAREEMTVSLEEALSLLEREIKENTPLGAHQLLRSSLTHQLMGKEIGDGLGVAGKVFSPLNYALPVELGTKPHFPPIAPLQDWVEAKLGVDKSESRAVAFLIARKISRRGTKGAHMAEKTLSKHGAQVVRIIEAALPRIVARIEGGK